MFSKLITIFICFSIVVSSRLHSKKFKNVEDHFIKLEGVAGSDDHGFDPRSQDKENHYKQATCGKQSVEPKAFERIMEGEEAVPHSWPWQVSIQYKVGDTFEHFCGGTIISATRVLSAAHCVFDTATFDYKSITNMYVVAGIHNIDDSNSPSDSQSMKVIEVAVPEYYHPRHVPSPRDIALLYIASPGFTFDDKVQPVCLPTSPDPVESNCYTTGWGILGSNQTNINKKLHQVSVPIISHGTCSASIGPLLWSTMMCAGYPEGSTNSCQGDDGGPLVCHRWGQWQLDGILISGDGCGEPMKPVVYTKVIYYLNWINSR